MIQVLCILSCMLASISLKKTLTLSVEPAIRPPLLRIDSKENIWYQDYWGHTLTKMDPTGKMIFQLKGPGEGPGELKKPVCFTLVDQEKTLLVLHSYMKLAMYSSSTGQFKKDLSKSYLAIRLYPWDKDNFLALKDPTAESGPGFELYDYRKAKAGKSWYRRTPSGSTTFFTSWFAFAHGVGNTIYYQPGHHPEIYVFKNFENTPHVWKLKPPPGYIKSPEKTLPEKDRYNREKMDAYANSFTQVRSFVLLKSQMIVCWFQPESEKFYYQAYDTAKETLVRENLPIQGQLISVVADKLYTLVRADLDDPGDGGREKVLVYGTK